jgi:hypothetical protein
VVSKSPAEFQKFIVSEVQWMAELAKNINVKTSRTRRALSPRRRSSES